MSEGMTDSEAMTLPVACESCTACCRNQRVFLFLNKGDRLENYEGQVKWGFNPLQGRGQWQLKQKANGDCVYLGEAGCTIYDRRPNICAQFDCRQLFLNFDRLKSVQKKQSMRRASDTRRLLLGIGRAKLKQTKGQQRG